MAKPTVEQRARRLCHDLRHALGCDIHPRAYEFIVDALHYRDGPQTGDDAERAQEIATAWCLESVREGAAGAIFFALRDAERRGAEAMRSVLRDVEQVLVEDTNAEEHPCCGWGPLLAKVRAALPSPATPSEETPG